MNKATPKVSVLMSVYNGSRYLRESIDSILNQTFSDLEFIIIDDCSTDDSRDIISEYAEKDQRIVLITNPKNIGLTKSLNKGLKIAKGEYVARQDADDISLPNRLAKQVSLLDKQLEVALVSCEIEYINSEGHTIGKDQEACVPELVAWYLLFYNRLAGHSQVIFRHQLAMNLGGYSESYRYSQDYEFWCRIVKVGKIFILPEILLQQRRHNQSISLAKSSEQESYALTQVKRNISELIGQEISLEEAKYLMKFWMGQWTQSLLSGQKVAIIHPKMKEIFSAFLQQQMQTNISHHNMSYQLRIIIANQFISWIQALIIKYSFMEAILVSLYALNWYPLGVLKYWYQGIKNVINRKFNLLFLKQNIKVNT